jgi:deoxyribose-phosphate aldolase
MHIRSIAGLLDHTLLRQDATRAEIQQICLQAIQHGFATVAIHPLHVPLAHAMLTGSTVGITVAISYPQGNWDVALKCAQLERAVRDGATDCDYVLDVRALLDGKLSTLRTEGLAMRTAACDSILKVILEVALLTDAQIAEACSLYAELGFDYVKTSTGFLRPATHEQVALMVQSVKGSPTKVKAAGGITTLDQALALLEVGASRLGTSAGVAIMAEWAQRNSAEES